MKIISKWKDYYDHIANLYGVDTSVVYKRLALDLFKLKPISGNRIEARNLPRTIEDYNKTGFNFKLISICGKSYHLISDADPLKEKWELYKPEKCSDKINSIMNKKNWYTKQTFLDQTGVFSESLLKIHRILDTPVFTFRSNYDGSAAFVEETIPVLGDLGIPSILPAGQIYQEISYFISNIMKSSPDTVVNDNLTNKEKIVSHGFDLKASFRHRK